MAVPARPTGCGKTKAILQLIDGGDSVCLDPAVEVMYCYSTWQDAFDRHDDVSLVESMIDLEKNILNDGQVRWLIVDELMDEVADNGLTNGLFTKYSNYRNVSVFLSRKTCSQRTCGWCR